MTPAALRIQVQSEQAIVLFANTAGASATFYFGGESVAWVGPKKNNHGIAQVYIDGKLVGEVNSYAAKATKSVILFKRTGLRLGQHTLKIVVSNKKAIGSQGINQELFGFLTDPFIITT
ncbi:hypothetical protein BC936DRAFT_138471 [Jimgerdemannia flammicorona]|uniref:Uncharacterized protein n=2 Tax=Jimgerdemannia flammicorona TaxID=994334 RepID=A0A433DIB7_9FUNG|nr:hypothetical protein BC936DRAFT_138471 [Jimgerdemannia flammicorona]RUS33108.1 hypothetical protein BC938DRAFT_473051 [Jimgerdemannia flammicorona]